MLGDTVCIGLVKQILCVYSVVGLKLVYAVEEYLKFSSKFIFILIMWA